MGREDWFKILIKEFRGSYEDLSEGEKEYISNLDDLTEPCQILSITFDNPSLTKTFILHLPNVDDGTVWEYGPIRPYEAFELFEKIIADPVYDIPIDVKEQLIFYETDEPTTVRVLLDNSLMAILREIKERVFSPPSTYSDVPSHKSYFLKRSAIWTYSGDITKVDPAFIIREIIQTVKRTYEHEQTRLKAEPLVETKQQKIQESSELEYSWHGTFLFPPVSIGKLPRASFSERLFGGRNVFQLDIVVFEDKFNERNFIATHNGFVGIEEVKNKVALEMLNVLVAALLLKGSRSYVIRDHELGDFQYNIDSKQFGSWTIPMTPRFSILDKQRQQDYTFQEKTKLTKEELFEALRDAERYWNDSNLRFYIPLFLESFTHFAESEYSQSFFMSWVIIEMYLTRNWEAVLHQKGISEKRLEKLTNPGMWSIDYIIEMMSLQDTLSNDDYEIMMKLKKRRNEILHRTARATKEDAEKSVFASH